MIAGTCFTSLSTADRHTLPLQVVTEHDLIQRSEAFEHAIAGGDKGTLQGFCVNKAQVRRPRSQQRPGIPNGPLGCGRIPCHDVTMRALAPMQL